MRSFMLICIVSIVAGQYNYGPAIVSDGSNTKESKISPEPLAEEYNKIFYSYSAPDQEFDDLKAEEQITKALRRNLRVIFIKGPENTALENAALQLAKSAADDHTAIYVLSKQSDIGSLANQLQEIKSKDIAKPEVHFVKYRTQSDAENAQQAIHAQYASLPGVSSNTNVDSASVLNFASKSDLTSSGNNVAFKTPVAATTAAPSRGFSSSRHSYLPPSKRY